MDAGLQQRCGCSKREGRCCTRLQADLGGAQPIAQLRASMLPGRRPQHAPHILLHRRIAPSSRAERPHVLQAAGCMVPQGVQQRADELLPEGWVLGCGCHIFLGACTHIVILALEHVLAHVTTLQGSRSAVRNALHIHASDLRLMVQSRPCG